MKLLNFGSLNLDHVYQVPHFQQPGETLQSDSLQTMNGGKGLNQSIALARAGMKVYHAGAVGRTDGNCLIEVLEMNQVDVSNIACKEIPTGHAVIQVDYSGQNCILLYGGANQAIDTDMINQVLSEYSSGDWLLLQNEINGIPEIMEQAYRRGMHIILNPSPADTAILEAPIQLAEYLILNEVEGQFLTGTEDELSMLQTLHNKYSDSNIILTLGEAGAYYWGKQDLKPIKEESRRVKAIDTTAAGDTFTGYFFASIIKGETPAVALKMATDAAAIAVTRKGAEPSIPWRNEIA